MKKIVFTGGGTGGHIMPNLSLIEVLQNDYQIYYLGSNGMEKNILAKYPKVKFIEIPVVKFVRSLNLKNLTIPFKLFSSIRVCEKILKEISPNVIFSKGGFVSIPVCLAGQKLKIPTITHESDITMGLANKIISKKATAICCSFESTTKKCKKNAIFTGSPIRQQIFKGNKENIINTYHINTNKPIVLITGGSLGASAINSAIWDNLQSLTSRYTLLHIVGRNKLNKEFSNSSNYIQLEFAPNIEDFFAVADIVISRAGSNTLFELLALNKPMLLIPLPKKSSRGDQLLNTAEFYSKGYCEYILQENINEETILNKLNTLHKNKLSYIKNMKNAPNPNGTQKIISIIKKYL